MLFSFFFQDELGMIYDLKLAVIFCIGSFFTGSLICFRKTEQLKRLFFQTPQTSNQTDINLPGFFSALTLALTLIFLTGTVSANSLLDNEKIPRDILEQICKQNFQNRFSMQKPSEALLTKAQRDAGPLHVHLAGEQNFRTKINRSPLFIGISGYVGVRPSKKRYALNSSYYRELIRMLFPIFQLNKKGIIIVSSIREAENLKFILTQTVKGIEFDISYWIHGSAENNRVLTNSRITDSHYTIIVGDWGRARDWPDITAYINLDVSVQVQSIVQDITEIAKSYNGKQAMDMFYLTYHQGHYRQYAEDFLGLLDDLETVKEEEVSTGSEAQEKRASLFKAKKHLQQSLRNFLENETINRIRDEEAVISGKKRQSGWGISGEKSDKRDSYTAPSETNTKSSDSQTEDMPYEEAKAYITPFDLQDWDALEKWLRSDQRPENFPENPYTHYNQTGEWEHILVFLGKYMSYEEAENYIWPFELKGRGKFHSWRKSDKRHLKIPPNPHEIYWRKWKNWPEFLGVNSRKKIVWKNHREIKAYMIYLGLPEEDFDEWYLSESQFLPQLFVEIRQSQIQSSNVDIIDAKHFTDTKGKPRYNKLVQLLQPVFQSDKKGVIVAPDIMEARKLQRILTQAVKDSKFEIYDSSQGPEANSKILENADKMTSHYVIMAGGWIRAINLSDLSVYINLNRNISIKDMIADIGKLFHSSPSEQSSVDSVFLVDYANRSRVQKRDLNFLEKTLKDFGVGTRTARKKIQE